MRFEDRTDAGRRLARALLGLDLEQPLVLALPRGGVPVALEVACALDGTLDVFVARKIGAPRHRELGIGAIAEGGRVVADTRAARALGVSDQAFDELVAAERAELLRRVETYRPRRSLPDVAGRDVVLVDDGLATGVTADAALRSLRARHPRRLVLAVPVCAPDTADRLRSTVDELVCLHAPRQFRAVGQWYADFRQVTDEEVLGLLAQAAATPRGPQK